MAVFDDKNFDSYIKTGVSVVEFYSLWDSASRAFEDSFRKLAEEFNGRAKFIVSEINANPLLAHKQGISRVPTILIYINGKQVYKTTDTTKRLLREKIEYFLRKKEDII
ncbi:MAG: protein disulfide isomerase family protein [Candidatus Woesearchaeota archaeon]